VDSGGVRRRAGLGTSDGRRAGPWTTPRLRPGRDRRVRAGAARAAARLAAPLRDHVLPARRYAGQQFPGEAAGRERRERLVVPPARFPVSTRVAARQDQKTPHRIRVGTQHGTHVAPCRHHRVRGGGRSRWRPRLAVREPTRSARAGRRACHRSAARRAGFVLVAWRRRVTGIRRLRRDRLEERPRRGPHPGAHHRLPAATRIRWPGRALAHASVCLPLRGSVLRRRRALANRAQSGRRPRRPRRAAPARGRDAVSAPGPPGWPCACVRPGRAGDQGPRIRRLTERLLPGRGPRLPARHVPARRVR